MKNLDIRFVKHAWYWIQKNKALKKWKIDKKATGWSFLYLNVKEMSAESMDIRIIYYNKAGEKVIEQPHVLTKGENIVILQYPGEELYRMGIRIYGAKGQFLSIQSMQLRENARGFSVQRFGKLMAVSYLGFLAALAVFWQFWNRAGKRMAMQEVNGREEAGPYFDILLGTDKTAVQKRRKKGSCFDALQEIYQILIEDICRWVHKRTSSKGRIVSRKLLW